MRSPSQLFKDAFALVKAHLVLFVGIMIVPVIITFVASLFEPAENTGVVNVTESVVYMALMLVVIVVSVLSSAAMILALNNPSLSIGESYKASVRFFWSYLGLSILMTTIILIGFLLLIIPGIIVSVWLAFASFALILENAGIIDSMRRSREYVRGRWWAVFGRFALLGIAFMLFTMVEIFILTAIPSTMVALLVQSAASLILAPFMMAYVYFIYQDLKNTSATVAAPAPAL